MDKIIRLNMLDQSISIQKVDPKHEYIGGRYLTSTIVNEEVPATCEPLGRHNKIVIAPGLLGGTFAAMSNRLSVGAKSPLTGGIKESNIGGSFARKLALMGYKAIVIEEKPSEDDGRWHMLYIDANGATLKPAEEYIGLDNYETCALLRERLGKHINIMTIGVAGERQYSSATCAVADDDGIPARHAGRGGMGAVMGSKRVKCIVLDDPKPQDVGYRDREAFVSKCREWNKEIIPKRQVLTKLGTANLVAVTSRIGALACRNFSLGSFDEYEKISGEKMYDTIVERKGDPSHGCYKGCIVRCSNVYNGPDGEHLTSSLEFETLGLMGSNLNIADLDTVARLDRFCDGFGMDTIELGAAFGVVMESGLCEFGDIDGVWKLVEEVKSDTIFGKLLAHGCVVTGKVLGVQKVPAVKGQSFAAYEPRALKGLGVTYAVSPMGADHTYGNCLPGRPGYRPVTQTTPEPGQREGSVEWAKDMQTMTAICDAMGLCYIAVSASWDTVEKVSTLLNLKYEAAFKPDDLIIMGKKMIRLEVEFNERAGLTAAHNRMPEYMMEMPIRTGDVFDIPEEELQDFYNKGFETV
ncbi:MAG: aldehyde ferredoxin oxidoreductase [Spirochaetes bacterium]|nr:aldehyde ferredoxin oxidoreductase [Spirochaetota bacterium]